MYIYFSRTILKNMYVPRFFVPEGMIMTTPILYPRFHFVTQDLVVYQRGSSQHHHLFHKPLRGGAGHRPPSPQQHIWRRIRHLAGAAGRELGWRLSSRQYLRQLRPVQLWRGHDVLDRGRAEQRRRDLHCDGFVAGQGALLLFLIFFFFSAITRAVTWLGLKAILYCY